MSEKGSNKTVYCCGCAGIGCLGIIVAIIVGGYYGVNFVADKGRIVAAKGLQKTVKTAIKDAFEQKDADIINKKVAEVAKDIESGKVGLVQLVKNVSKNIEGSTLFAQTMALAFKNKYLTNAEAGGDNQEAVKSVSTFIYALSSKKVDREDSNDFLRLVSKQFKSKVKTGNGKNKKGHYTYTGKELNPDLSKEQVSKVMETIKSICSKYSVNEQPKDFNPSETVKSQYLDAFKKLYEK